MQLLVSIPWVRWLLITCGWMLASLLFTVQSYYYYASTGAEVSFTAILLNDVITFVLWAILTPFLIWISNRNKIEGQRWLARLFILLSLAGIVAVAHRALVEISLQVIKATGPVVFDWNRVIRMMIGYSDYSLLVCLVVLLVHQAYTYYRRFQQEQTEAERLKSQLAEVQLQVLRSQLHPHFLFNTLNTISVLIEEDPKAANSVLRNLSDLLRTTLDHVSSQEISLKSEIAFLDRYLSIELARFGDRLHIDKQVETDTLDALVPSLLLQPLVENAIKHGIGNILGPGSVKITTRHIDDDLILEVSDTGAGLATNNHGATAGVGLRNTRARLQQLYGENHSFELLENNGEGVRVFIRIPYHKAPYGITAHVDR